MGSFVIGAVERSGTATGWLVNFFNFMWNILVGISITRI